jgi:hypothetical protein
MSTQQHTRELSRRVLLRRAGAVTAGTVAATAAASAMPAVASGDGTASVLTGGWLTERDDAPIGGKALGVFTFSTGGAVHYQDIFPLGPVVHGSWREGRHNSFRYEIWAGYLADPAAGAPDITARVTGNGTYTRRTFEGPYVVTLFDAASGTEIFQFAGVATANRIEP